MLEDLLLAQLPFQLQGQRGFLELARDRAVLAQKHRAGELLGDRAGPFTHRSLAHIGDDGPGNAPAVDAVMLVEATVLGRDERLLHQQGHVAGFELVSGGGPELLNHLAPAGEQRDRAWPVEAGDASGIRQVGIHQSGDSLRADGRSNAHTCGSRCNQAPVQV